MSDLAIFVPVEAAGHAENLCRFIEVARRELSVFGKELDFDANAWDVTDGYGINVKRSKRHIYFSAWSEAGRGRKAAIWMAEPYLSFAKAYVRYQQGLNPKKGNGSDLAALRLLECALMQSECDLSFAHAAVFNKAAKLAQDHFTPATSYAVGRQLQALATFLSRNRLIKVPFQWTSWISRQADTVRVGARFDAERVAKMPSGAALQALPQIFHLAKEPGDVIVSSIIAILCSAPDRINEILRLPNDCEVKGDPYAASAEAYGLRWWTSKGADPMIKWIIPSMSSVVVAALEKIRHQTNEARKIAAWYEQEPKKVYLPPHLAYLRKKKEITSTEVLAIAFDGKVAPRSCSYWLRDHNIPSERRKGRTVVQFSDLESAVLKMLPRGFPYLDKSKSLKYSEALFVVPLGAMHTDRATYSCAIAPVNYTNIHRRLGRRSRGILGDDSIFEKFGLAEKDGSPVKVTTHQFRHYLNTLAQAGGMSQLDIAKWSGRRDVHQNVVYDHVSADTLLTQIRQAVGDDHRMFGPLATLPDGLLISRDEFARLQVPTAHTTDFGYCIHDYAMTPCQLHGDCLSCHELLCVKGAADASANLEKRIHELTRLLAQAQAAEALGEFGASRWTQHHQAELVRLIGLRAILANPEVPDGAYVQLFSLDKQNQVEYDSLATLPDAPQLTPLLPERLIPCFLHVQKT